MPGLLLAHNTAGFSTLGFVPGLLVYVALAGFVLLVLGLRAGWPRAHWESPPSPSRSAPAGLAVALRLLGLALLAFTVVCGLAGSRASGLNPAVPLVYGAFWLGLPLVSLAAGDVWGLLNPVQTVADLVGRRTLVPARPSPRPATTVGALANPDPELADAPSGDGAAWLVPAVGVLSLGWLFFGSAHGLRPRTLAWWLVAYTVVYAVLAATRGSDWVRRHEAFGLLSSTLAWAAPVGPGPDGPGPRNPARVLRNADLDRPRLAVLIAVLGITLFDAASYTRFWADLIQGQSLTETTVSNTVGLLWTVGLVAVVWAAAARLAARLGGADRPRTDPLVLATLLPLAGAAVVAHDLGVFSTRLQDLVALLSDPLARGDNLFGTSQWVADPDLVSATRAAWAGFAVLALAHGLTAVSLHDRWAARPGPAAAAADLRRLGYRPAAWPLVALVGVSLAVTMRSLLGA